MSTLVLLSSVLVLVACLWAAARRAQAPRPAAPRPAATLSFERVGEIRRAAEDAALQVALGRAGSSRNPYRERSREAVLWTTSFSARLMEFETEAFAPAPAAPALVR